MMEPKYGTETDPGDCVADGKLILDAIQEALEAHGRYWAARRSMDHYGLVESYERAMARLSDVVRRGPAQEQEKDG